MARYSAGDDAAFDVVYESICPSLEQMLLRRTGDARLTEDLLQHTFLKIHCHRGSFREGEAVMPWARAIALRLLIDRIRHRQRESHVLSGAPLDEQMASSAAPGPEQLLASRELLRQLEAELERLPDAHRRAFEVVRLEGQSLADAAMTLETTVPGVKLRLFRATERLRAYLRGDLGNGGGP